MEDETAFFNARADGGEGLVPQGGVDEVLARKEAGAVAGVGWVGGARSLAVAGVEGWGDLA